MQQHPRFTSRRFGVFTETRRLTARTVVGVLALAIVLVIALGMSSTHVGALTTDSAKVANNEFAVASHIDVGSYALEAVPSVGQTFGPGTDSGHVQFAMQPEGSEPVAVEKGDVFTIDVRLPMGVTPGTLPADDSVNGLHRTWAKSETDGRWAVTSRMTSETRGLRALPSGSFEVVTELSTVMSDEELNITASAGLPERFVSNHPEESTLLPVAWRVALGVYELELSGAHASGTAIRVSNFADISEEQLYLRAGDAIVTTVSVPASVTPGSLPQVSAQPGMTAEWASVRTDEGWKITLTERVTEPIRNVQRRVAEFPATLSSEAWTDGFVMSAHVELPQRLSSAQDQTETRVPGRITSPALGRISAGGAQSMAVVQDGTGYGWGYNGNGRVGNGTTENVLSPTRLETYSKPNFRQISAGGAHTVGLGGDSRIYGWGVEQWPWTGGTEAQRPVLVGNPGAGPFTQVSAGYEHSLALGPNGTVYGWGRSWYGALGDRSTISRPTALGNPSGVEFTQVEAGAAMTFGLASDGTVWGMGANTRGGLGLGPDIEQVKAFTQIPMPNDAKIVQLVSNGSTFSRHTLALTDTGEVISWGANSYGEAGATLDGDSPAVFDTPTKIALPNGVRFTKLAAGDGVSLGISHTGEVYSWGGKTLGHTASGNETLPRKIEELPATNSYVDITAGDEHAFALSDGGELFGWGAGGSGRLGNNSAEFHVTPVVIALPSSRTVEQPEPTAVAPSEDRPETDEASNRPEGDADAEHCDDCADAEDELSEDPEDGQDDELSAAAKAPRRETSGGE